MRAGSFSFIKGSLAAISLGTPAELAYHLRHMLELWWLEKFVSAPDNVAEDVFTKHIRPAAQRFLGAFLRSYLVSIDDRQEVIGIVLGRLWASRHRLEVRNVGSWWRYVGRIAHNCALDHLGRPSHEVLTDHEGDHEFEDEFWDSLDVTRLYRAADELWLGVSKAEPYILRDQKLFAIQLLLEGTEIADILADVKRDKPISRKEFDEWMMDRSVISRLAHLTMYRAPEELAHSVLHGDRPFVKSNFEEFCSDARKGTSCPPPDWTWEEARCVLLRYANGFSEKKIVQHTEVPSDCANRALTRGRECLPLRSACERLLKSLRKKGFTENPFKNPGVWKRTTFQYDARSDYPQKLILELLEPLGELGPFKFNAGILNMWVSGERLLNQLRDYIKPEVVER